MVDPLNLISHLSELIDKKLDELIPASAAVALIDIPTHTNIGDTLIWLGTRIYLTQRQITPRYVCTPNTYQREDLFKAIGDGVILLSGGGNFGDMWPRQQQLRERVIADFPDNLIVQLPQSIYFQDKTNLERAKIFVNSHKRLNLIVRDRQSLDIAKNAFQVPIHMCPDMSLNIGVMERVVTPTVDVLWLSRDDREARGILPPNAPNLLIADWIVKEKPAFGSFAEFAHWQVERGKKFLGQARVVVSDRLHGYLLSLMLGIPHVVIDNIYGKPGNFHQTWTSESQLTRHARSPAEAWEIAQKLVADAKK